MPTVADPTFTPAAGSYNANQTITIATTTGGSSIRYTTDGSTPTSSGGLVYSTPVVVNSSKTLKAIAYQNGYTDSVVVSAAYVINVYPAAIEVTSGVVYGPHGTGFVGAKPTPNEVAAAAWARSNRTLT